MGTQDKQIENFVNGINDLSKYFLPPCSIYGKYLNIAIGRFKITMEECRDKFGEFTIRQWEELFNKN